MNRLSLPSPPLGFLSALILHTGSRRYKAVDRISISSMVTKRKIPVDFDGPVKKKGRRLCSVDECANYVVRGGVCRRHGAKRKTCSHEGCTSDARKGGICVRHGAEITHKICSHEGCTNQSKKGGVCTRHGAKPKICSHKGCTNIAVKGGICVRHGAERTRKTCGHEGCTNGAVRGGVCKRHGATAKGMVQIKLS